MKVKSQRAKVKRDEDSAIRNQGLDFNAAAQRMYGDGLLEICWNIQQPIAFSLTALRVLRG